MSETYRALFGNERQDDTQSLQRHDEHGQVVGWSERFAWFALVGILNSLNRSVGMPDAYPFTLSTPVIDKLRFVHTLEQKATQQTPMQ